MSFIHDLTSLNLLFLQLRRSNYSTVNKRYFVTEIVLTYYEKKNTSDREKLLKFEAEGREFAKVLRSLEQFIQTMKGQNNFW